MSLITRVITQDWYTGASLYYTVYDTDNGVLQSRTQMSEFPSGSGCFHHKNIAWDLDWIGRIVFDDGGAVFESKEVPNDADFFRAVDV